ncbi:pyridoxal phosphate-dependent aminotransferase [Edaphobacillus lindanitolerans]|uniref:Aminotransferase n=1 Tax=Edaphobacillus lindanitolerans TaxID=550447 RepID=A0A1U7PHC1_9BACI|nr:pyridoxal phosphate-dependent aminotransferase [Edaphobacillus lindanitolerans]SIT66295.1 aspartate aminotransferase [Edaphobacillus lindanitolerans]
MNRKLATRTESLTPSTTLAITAKAKAMKKDGIDVIGLGAGEPDFNTPENIIEAAYKSMEEGKTKYTPSGGLPELKQAIINKMQRDHGLTYSPSEVIVGVGAKHVLYTLFQVILDPGDEVVIPIPYWVSYPEQVKLAGGKPVFIEGTVDTDFKVSAQQLRSAITDRTKAFILNSPSNPSGMIYTEEELKELASVCKEADIWIISDEIYEKLLYGGATHTSVAQLSGDAKERTIVINGVSKSHSMTGWRIGYACGDERVIKPMTDLASHSTSNPATPSQYAAIEAYEGPQDAVEMMRKDFGERLEAVYPLLAEVPGFRLLKPQGAFYLLPDVTEAVRKTGFGNTDEFAKALLEEANVAVIPGSGFGAPDTIRLSYATELGLFKEAVRRIREFVEKRWQD